MSSLAEIHHSDKEKMYCMPNAAWMKHLSEWTLIFQENHALLNQRVCAHHSNEGLKASPASAPR
jgi:hypothetical protein